MFGRNIRSGICRILAAYESEYETVVDMVWRFGEAKKERLDYVYMETLALAGDMLGTDLCDSERVQ